MKYTLAAIQIIFVLIHGIAQNAASARKKTFDKIIGNIKTELDTLLTLIKDVTKGKCNDVTRKEPQGAAYTRWGHNGCPVSQTRLVYSGYAGGGWYGDTGAAADYICLTRTPTQYNNRNKYTDSFGYLYGGEYQFGGSNFKHNHDVPCAVCQSMSRTSAIMLPGSDVCPKGWHLEYKGLLMSGKYSQKAASQHVCVDYATKTLHGGRTNQNGRLFYPVKTRCGTLKCPPYKNKQFVTCAVCTR